MTTLNWEKFAPLFGTWSKRIKPYFDAEGFDPIYTELKQLSKRGAVVAPLSFNLYKCFQICPLNDLKLVIIGEGPYTSLHQNLPLADGTLLGGDLNGSPPFALENFYRAAEGELYNGLNLDYIHNTSLEYLGNQGVLLINSSFTGLIGTGKDHSDLWKPFIDFLLREIIISAGVPVLLLGEKAWKFKEAIPAELVICKSHPAEKKFEWDSGGAFRKIQKILKETNNTEIEFLDLDVPF